MTVTPKQTDGFNIECHWVSNGDGTYTLETSLPQEEAMPALPETWPDWLFEGN